MFYVVTVNLPGGQARHTFASADDARAFAVTCGLSPAVVRIQLAETLCGQVPCPLLGHPEAGPGVDRSPTVTPAR